MWTNVFINTYIEIIMKAGVNELGRSDEIKKFEGRYSKKIVEIAAVTGPLGPGASKTGEFWIASIDLIAWKMIDTNEPAKIEEKRLCWLADEEQWEKSKNLLRENSIVRLLVRVGEQSLMLVQVLDPNYQDHELENILQEALKPVYYFDKVLGMFVLNKSIKTFEKEITWAQEKGELSFDLDDESAMKEALKTAHILLKDEEKWNKKIRKYAAQQLLELANDWIVDDEEVDEITEEMFINLMEFSCLCVYPNGDFDVFFDDGDMFLGHSIIVSGNINGEFTSAEISG